MVLSLWAELSKGIVYCSDSTENLFKVIKKKFIKISLIYLLFDLFCDNNNTILTPPLHTEIQKYKLIYMLWFNFILGLNFIFFCFKLIFYHTSPYPKTYLPWKHGKLPVKESRDANLGCRSWRLSMFHFPPPLDCQQPHYPHHPPPPTLSPNWPGCLRELCEVWSEVVALSTLSMAI